MNYDNPQLVDALAREYVLGTLRGPARRRFERVARSNLLARRAVNDWQRQLAGLAGEVEPVAPPAHIWQSISRAIGAPRASTPARTSRVAGLLAAGFALVAMVFGGLYLTREAELLPPTYIAVLQDAENAPAWSVQAYLDLRRLRIRPLGDAAPPPDRVFELWMLPADGSNPVSLGVIAAATPGELSLDERQAAILRGTKALAISVEPPGGSPTGVPTGDVLFVGGLFEG